MAYRYPIISPAGVEVGSITDDSPDLQPAEVYSKFQQQQQQGFQRTGGEPGAPSMQPGVMGAIKRGGQYLQEHVAQPIKDVAQMASEDIKGAMVPGYKKQPDPTDALGSLAAIGGTALFPAASVGTLVGGTTGAASGVPGAQTAGEIIGGLVGGGPGLKKVAKGLFKNKEQQIEKFTQDFLHTPGALKEDVKQFIPGFKDQPITLSKQIGEPLANDAKVLLEKAREIDASVPTTDLRKIVTDALVEQKGKGLKSKGALEALIGAEKDIPQGTASYSKLDDVVSDLNSRAHTLEKGTSPDTKGAHILHDMANNITDAMDKVSTVGRAGRALYRQDKLAIDVIKNLRMGKIAEVENMLLENHTIAERFGWDTPAKLQAAVDQLKKIKAVPTQGSIMLALQKIGGSGLLAYALHRGIFDFVFSGHGRGE